jgi:Arc/MetJ-type ribon-helix-helix transcriptional regulator
LPSVATAGAYTISIAVVSETEEQPAVRLGIKGRADDGWYPLSKVEVVRRGLRLLRDATEREALREAYRRASRATRASVSHELRELDHLTAEASRR